MLFSDLGLAPSLATAASKYPEPTPVQVEAIPVVLTGRDLLATAQTGSGKTVAFVLPLLQRWLETPRSERSGVHTLILVPTRELAAQVRDVVQEFSTALPTRPKVVSTVGGVSINPQMMALRGGADFLVATPGRLLDLAGRNAVQLNETTALVLDEADRMLDLGFAEELNQILPMLPKRRQNLLFSATFPASVESIANKFLLEPSRIELVSEPAERPLIQQRAIRVDEAKRGPLLRHLLRTETWDRVLVFVASQYTADHVADKLSQNKFNAAAFHGDLSQGEREAVLTDFKSGTVKIVVATDLAARGLDIAELPAVVNYDLPRSTNEYTHRIGRTGRAGEAGVAISFVTAGSTAHFCLIEKRQNLQILREELPGFEPVDLIPPPSTTGGVKGMRKSKKDKLREIAARKKRQQG